MSLSPGLQVSAEDAAGNPVLGNPTDTTPNPDATRIQTDTEVSGATGPARDEVQTATYDLPGVQSAGADAVPTIDPVTKFETALATFSLNVGIAVTVGAMIGGVGGALVGCVVPGLAGAAVALVGAIPACIIGGATVGGLGAIIGGAALGIPVAVVSGVQLAQTSSS